MSATMTIVALWLAFSATHMGFSGTRVRAALVARLAEQPLPMLVGVCVAAALRHFHSNLFG